MLMLYCGGEGRRSHGWDDEGRMRGEDAPITRYVMHEH
jgi:hypothetical protein